MFQIVRLLILIIIASSAFTHVSAMNVTSKLPHKLTILEDGPAAFQARIELIRRAKKSINIEYYIFQRHTTSQILVKELIKKSMEGVKVRILLDNYPLKMTNFYAPYFKKYGIALKYYNTNVILRFEAYNYRTHRKIISVDGNEAIVGGRNIGDEYFEYDHEFNFYDRDVLVQGPIVNKIDQTYEEFWTHDLSMKPTRLKRPLRRTNKYEQTDDYKHYQLSLYKARQFFDFSANQKNINRAMARYADLGGKQLNSYKTFECHNTQYVSDKPGWKKTASIQGPFVMETFRNSKKSLILASPYFITQEDDQKLFGDILKKGVEVKLLSNSLRATDAIHVNTVFNSRISYFLERGLKAYAFTGEQVDLQNGYYANTDIKPLFGVHSKSFVVDGEDSYIGTYNYDPRSKNYNAEINIVCHDNPEMAAQLTANIEKRMGNAVEIDEDGTYVKKLSPEMRAGFLKKVMTALVHLPSVAFDDLL